MTAHGWRVRSTSHRPQLWWPAEHYWTRRAWMVRIYPRRYFAHGRYRTWHGADRYRYVASPRGL